MSDLWGGSTRKKETMTLNSINTLKNHTIYISEKKVDKTLK